MVVVASSEPPTGSRVRRHLPRIRRAGWNLVDQALSALTNVVLSFLVARQVSAEEFGAFAVAFLVFSLTVGVVRSLVGQPLGIRYSAVEGPERVVTMHHAFAATLAVALPVSAGALAAGAIIGGSLGPTLMALAVVLPFMVLQDVCRSAFFAWARPELATLNDSVWAVVQFSGIGLLVALGHSQAWTMVLAWGAGGAAGAVLGMAQLRALPRWAGVRRWVRANRDLVGYLFVEYLLGVGAYQGGILLIGGALGVSDIGSLRAAQVLVGPVGILATAATTFGVPEISRRETLPRHPMRIAGGASGAIVGATLVYTVLLLLIPEGLGVQLLGDTWTGASSVLLPVALGSAFAGGKLGPVILLYGMGLARKTIRLVTLLALLAVAGMLIGAALASAPGLAWGLALAQAVVMPLWFVQLGVVLRHPPPPGSAARSVPGSAGASSADVDPV